MDPAKTIYSPVRIMFVHNGLGWGGAPNSLKLLVQGLDREKFEPPLVAILDPSLREVYERAGTEVITVQGFPKFPHTTAGYVSPFSAAFYWRHWKAKLESLRWTLFFHRHQPDIVVLNSVTLCPLVKPAKEANCKVVQIVRETIVDGLFGFRKRMMERMMSAADACVFISDFDRDKSRDNAPRRMTIPNWTTFEPLNPNLDITALRTKWGVNPKAFVFLYVGGLSVKKGIDTLMRAAMKLASERKIVILFAGCDQPKPGRSRIGFLPEFLRNIAIRLVYIPSEFQNRLYRLFAVPKPANVELKFLGMQQNLAECYDLADALIFPIPRPHQGRPIFEAGAAGRPVIASRYPQLMEGVTEGENGYFFTPGDAEDLARAMKLMIANPENARRMGLENRRRTEERHNGATNLPRYISLFRELAEEHSDIKEVYENRLSAEASPGELPFGGRMRVVESPSGQDERRTPEGNGNA